MIESTYDYLSSSKLAPILGVTPRRVAHLLGQLEALGFKLEKDLHGARLVHPYLAAAVKAARDEGRDLDTLRTDPALRRFLVPSERDQDLDLLSLVINSYAELAIMRGAISALTKGSERVGNGEWQRSGWHGLALPDPRGEL